MNTVQAQENTSDLICNTVSAQQIRTMTREQVGDLVKNLRTTLPREDYRTCKSSIYTVFNTEEQRKADAFATEHAA